MKTKNLLLAVVLPVLIIITLSCKKEEVVSPILFDVTGTSWSDTQATKDISTKITLSINFNAGAKILGSMKTALQTTPSFLSGSWTQANIESKIVTITVVEGSNTWQGTGTISDDKSQMSGSFASGRSSIKFNMKKQ